MSLTWAQIWEGYVLVWRDIPTFFSAAGWSRIPPQIVPTALTWAGAGPWGGAVVVAAYAAGAFLLALLGRMHRQG